MKAASRSQRERIRSQCADLKMPGALEALDEILSRIDGGELTGAASLEALLQAQITLRNNRRLQAAMRSSRLPAIKTLDDFDFTFQPSIKREQIDSLHQLGFIERKENVIFLGPPGVGKTHLALSLAVVTGPKRPAHLLRLPGRPGHLPRGGADGGTLGAPAQDAHPSVTVDRG